MTENLLDLSREMDDIHREIQDNLGELTPELEARLDECGHALALKADNMAVFMADLNARVDGLKQFAKAVQLKAKVADNLRERLLGYCDLALGDKPEIKGDLFTIKRRANPPSVVITDEEALRRTCPDAFEKVVEWKIHKATVKHAIEQGTTPVSGAHIQQTQRIEIK